MPAAQVTVQGTVSGIPSGGSKTIGPYAFSNLTSGGAVTELTSAGGDNVITVPGSNYIGCTITPPVGNTAALKLKGSSGDTGVPLHLTIPTLYVFPAGTASFILNIGTGGLAFEINWF